MSSHYDYRFEDNPSTAEHSTPGWVVGLIAGAALGGGLALLFAPRQGTDTRHQLAQRGQQAGRQLRQAYDSVAGTTRRNARRLTEQAQDWRRSHVVREMLGEETSSTVAPHMESGEAGRGAASPAGWETRSPFA